MAERPIKPQTLNTLTSFYKNEAQKAAKYCVYKQIIWLYYGTSELKDGNKFSASLFFMRGKNRKKKELSIKPGYTERRKFSLQLGSSNCNQHALSELSYKLYQLKCQVGRLYIKRFEYEMR